MSRTDLVLRPGVAADLTAVADLYQRVRAAAEPAMPPMAFSTEQVRAYVDAWDLQADELWLAVEREQVVGYAMLRRDWLHSLYVDPDRQGEGIGGMLLDLARSLRPDGFCLFVFESNTPARRFYASHGLVELETDDGSGNPEGAPDVRVAWPGSDPLAFWRRLIDDVDDQLGDLLARRTALTRVVQQHKGAGAGRDPAREAEVAARVAALAPELGPERLARIVHVIITESLAAAGP